ncbi:MAG: hypothetical protein GTO55_07900 [Armatimonadetes bacterium]|nr:hypothetical protein [Armatimonadota bacterium]NIM24181.1 hypothetical protein [Armatimonadota bacterium]NIM68046.1 hypothetical protein [Armatimonadota bacterium]NIM76080.1 hypothetical protein [Armatimonadota bacterium]NIN05751.1 hypothetical protein [Armatimonadota bacterium]
MKEPQPASVVFLFGAGASADIGIPTMPNFRESLQKAAEKMGTSIWLEKFFHKIRVDYAKFSEEPDEEKLEAIWSLFDRDRLERAVGKAGNSSFLKKVFEEYTRLESSKPGDKLREENLEAIWSRLDMACTVGVPGVVEKERRKFVTLVGEAMRPRTRPEEHRCAYYDLITALFKAVGRERMSDDSIAFMTFNQDAALDCALWKGARLVRKQSEPSPPHHPELLHTERLRYWLGRRLEIKSKYPPKLLKLHGSMNWGICEDALCGSGVNYHGGGRLRDFPRDWGDQACAYHGEDKTRKHTPLVLGPSWLRQPHGHELRRIWGRAHVDLRGAKVLIVVGHSFPESDVYFKHFLSLAVGRRDTNASELKFLIVNRNSTHAGCYAKRLKELGCKALTVTGIPDGLFEEDFKDAIPRIAQLVGKALPPKSTSKEGCAGNAGSDQSFDWISEHCKKDLAGKKELGYCYAPKKAAARAMKD